VSTHAPRAGAPSRPRAPWDWVDVAVVIVVGLVLLGGLADAAISQAVHHADSGLSAQDRSSLEAMVGQLAFYAVAISVTLFFLATRRGIAVSELGWRRTSLRWLLAALPLAVLGLAIAGVLGGIAQALLPSAQNQQCIAVQKEYGHSILLALPVVCVAAPIVEETIFRGVLYRWLRGVLPMGLAMLFSGAVFAAAHAVTLLFLPLLGFGVLLAWIYERSGSLWPGVIVHALFNLAGIIDILTAAKC
jgi:membrane protease YdiL (CAAX protease family)